MDSPDLAIRAFETRDRDAVAAITRSAWRGVTMAQLREERYGIVGGRPWQDHKVAEVLRIFESHPENAVVGEWAGHVVGYASLSVTHDGAVGVVGNNAVAPDWQGRGIGGQLIGHVIEELKRRGVAVLEVSTLEQDVPAQRVYQRHGFELVASTRHYSRVADRAT